MKFLFIFIPILIIGCSPLTIKDYEVLSYKEYLDSSQEKSISKFYLLGKISIFVDKKGFSGRINWKFNDDKSIIHIYNPFNTLIAKVTLNSSKKSINFEPKLDKRNDIEKIIFHLFGSKQNIFALRKMLTRPPNQLSIENRVSVKYQDWNVHFEGIKQIKENRMPHIIEFENKSISFKIYINQWVI